MYTVPLGDSVVHPKSIILSKNRGHSFAASIVFGVSLTFEAYVVDAAGPTLQRSAT